MFLFPNFKVYFWNKCLLPHGLLNLLQVCEGMILALENCFGTWEISLNLLAITCSPFGVESCQLALFYPLSDQNFSTTENFKFKFIISVYLLWNESCSLCLLKKKQT